MSTHILVRYGRPEVKVAEFTSFDIALGAWTAIVGDDTIKQMAFAVRSVDDPRWARAPWAEDALRREAERAGREFARKEIGATATSMLKAHADDTLHAIISLTRESLLARGIVVSRPDVDRAIKNRVIVGRCRKVTWMRGGCDRAFWMPKSAGRLADAECPYCHRQINQTTLAYGKAFKSLAFERSVAEGLAVSKAQA